MGLLEFRWWLEHGGGSLEYARFCEAWALEAEHAPERQQASQADAEDARMAAEGWRGGRVSPEDMAACGVFDDDEAAA